MPLHLARRVVLAAALSLGVLPAVAQDDAPVVAAAADLQFAVEEIAAAFEAETGQRVRLSFGSTGNFARQIREGAPFEIFMAADEKFIAELHRDGFTVDEGDLYAVGRIVLKLPHGSPLQADGSLDDLAAALQDGRLEKFAIANPEHAPYGMRAEEALRAKGLWEAIEPRLVLGENVSQAAAFALSGSTQGGIIALSLALAPQVAAQGSHALIPDDLHAPLLQRMVRLRDPGPVADAFYAYMKGETARGIMRRYGFLLPGEDAEGVL
ncbi:MAG: molybdate ABC transporter substrate-binding protein [Rubrimonas sp.]